MPNTTLDDLLSACREYPGGEPNDRLRHATSAFLAIAEREPSILRSAVASLATLPPPGAGWFALTFGSAIEQGTDVEITGPVVVDVFLAWLPKVPETSPNEPTASPVTAEQVVLLEALPHLCMSVVAHLSRMPRLREALSRDLALLARLNVLSGVNYGILWVHEVLLRRSGRIVVLSPPTGAGVRITYENVANCFHLFSLLQASLGTRFPGGRAPNQLVAAAARGEADEAVTDRAWWHYGDPRSNTASIGASIWGEASVDDIPVVKGAQVLLLWPPLLGGRSWDSGFFGPPLDAAPPSVKVEGEMTENERRAWFLDLGLAYPQRRKWWPW